MMKGQIDRRIIFLIIFIAVALPLIFKIGLPVEISENVKMTYKLIDKTESNSTVLFSFDYDPSSKPEIHPQALATTRHAIEKGQKIVCTALWPMGVVMANQVYDELRAAGVEIEYGKNFINLGYKAGGLVTLQAIGENFKKVFREDNRGTKLENLPMMKGIDALDKFEYVMSFSAGAPGIKEWVMVAHDRYDVNVSGGVTAVSAPAILPYVNEQQQLIGLLGGMKAAAEYEALIDVKGKATAGMDAQSIAHFLIIMFIIIGNINYFRNKKKKEEE